jgi:hypothetical protein
LRITALAYSARGAAQDLPFKFDAKTIQNGLNFTSTDAGDVDLLAEVSGLGTYEVVLSQSEISQVGATQCRILSLDGLIRTKQATGREKDLKALPELQALKELKERLANE